MWYDTKRFHELDNVTSEQDLVSGGFNVGLLGLVGSGVLRGSLDSNGSQVISVTLSQVRDSQSSLSGRLVLLERSGSNALGWLVGVLSNLGSDNDLTGLLSNAEGLVVSQTRGGLGVLTRDVQWVSGQNNGWTLNQEGRLLGSEGPDQVAV
jgi:hypothetical protein